MSTVCDRTAGAFRSHLVVDGDLARGGHLDHVFLVDVHHHRAVVALEDAFALVCVAGFVVEKVRGGGESEAPCERER